MSLYKYGLCVLGEKWPKNYIFALLKGFKKLDKIIIYFTDFVQ